MADCDEKEPTRGHGTSVDGVLLLDGRGVEKNGGEGLAPKDRGDFMSTPTIEDSGDPTAIEVNGLRAGKLDQRSLALIV